ncbi:hypothetical protein ES703_08492 [subsurface metagenome]
MICDYTYKIMRKNHALGGPRNCLYLDTETKTKEIEGYVAHRMKMAWTCSARYDHKGKQIREKYRYWESTRLMWDYIFSLAREKTILTLFAHNVFFDLQASDFFHYAQKEGWTYAFNWEDGMTYILVVKKDKRTLRILSSTNYFQSSLAELGEILGYPKGKVDFDKVSKKKLSEYCKRDVEILKKAMEFYFSFVLENDLGKFGMTQASQAFRAFRHRFMKEKICIHQDTYVKSLERASYMGGRVEAFNWREQTEGPFVTLDVNSMYPYVMKKHYVPVQLLEVKKNVSLDRARETLTRFCVVCEVELDTDKPIYAVRTKNKLLFPTGRFVTYLCTEGLKEALRRGHVKKILVMAVYRRAKLFDEYVDFFFTLKTQYKTEGNKVLETMCKLFLNTLYGKFGQKRTETFKWKDKKPGQYHKEMIFDLTRGIWITETHLLGMVIHKRSEGEAPHSCAAIAAHITESARLYLWELFEKVGFEKVMYCDTDSLKLRASDTGPLKPLMDKYRLGCLDLKDTNERLDIMGAKAYRTEDKLVMKGVPKKATRIDNYKYEYYTFFNQATHLNEGVTRYYLTKKTIKDVTPRYDKGEITTEGQIIPFQLQASGPLLSLLPEPLSFFSNPQVQQPGHA